MRPGQKDGGAVRVVVAGPYPTMPGPEAEATLSLVRTLLAEGHDVVVVSPAPSAAHHHADLGGARGAVRLARLAAGADRLVVRLDAAALRIGSDRAGMLPGRLALAAALRRATLVELHLDRVPPAVSRRWARLVASKATRVVVSTEEERSALVIAGVSPAAVTVGLAPFPERGRERSADAEATATVEPSDRPEPPEVDGRAWGRGPHAPEEGGDGAPPRRAKPLATAADLQALVQRRAASERKDAPAGAATRGGSASLPLRHLPRMERAPVRSAKPGGTLLKRALAKVMAWQFDNVIQHVNQLHQATIDAVVALETPQTEDETNS